MKHYYAINYPTGLAVSANTGKRYGDYFRFQSKTERDAWVEDGGDGTRARNYRETIPSSDSELRTELTNLGWGGYTIEPDDEYPTMETLETPI